MTNLQLSLGSSGASEHDDFLRIGAIIQRHSSVVFRQLPVLDREEAIAEALAAGFVSFVHLKSRGKNPFEFPSALATFAALHVKNGRRVGGRQKSRDVTAMAKAQRSDSAIRRFNIDMFSEALVDDSTTPILDQVAFRLDWAAFLQTRSSRDREIIRLLGIGHTAKGVASRLGISPGRVTQLRKAWRRQWTAFVDDNDVFEGN